MSTEREKWIEAATARLMEAITPRHFAGRLYDELVAPLLEKPEPHVIDARNAVLAELRCVLDAERGYRDAVKRAIAYLELP